MTSTIERIGEAAEPDREVAREESCGPGAMGGLWAQAREYIWLDDVRSGIGIKAIALREGVGERRVQYGVKRARARESASSLRDSRARDVLRDRDVGKSARTWGSAGKWGPGSGYPPRLIPLFPIGPFTPQSKCPHIGPIRPGSRVCCMICSRSGVDDHPELKRDPRTDPRPEAKALPRARPATGHETRKQRRGRLFAALQNGPSQAVAG
jgi:hypothetical protein